MVSLNIISGTDRRDSNALRVAKYLKEKYSEIDNVVPEIINLRDFRLKM
ncbi:MAG: hypothetical protein U5K69_01730 [Balneolaceae bacterium]|nr:hypothetical protein [Balneolaceae bacterium]